MDEAIQEMVHPIIEDVPMALSLSPEKQMRRVSFSDQVEMIDVAAVDTVAKEITKENQEEDFPTGPREEEASTDETVWSIFWYTRQELLSFFNDVRMTLLRNSHPDRPTAVFSGENDDGDCFTGLDVYMDAPRNKRRITAQHAILASHRHVASLEPLLLRLVANNNETIPLPTTTRSETTSNDDDDSSILLARVANQIARPACAIARQRGMETYCEAYPERVMEESPALWHEFTAMVQQRQQRQAHLLRLVRRVSQKQQQRHLLLPGNVSCAIARTGLPPAGMARQTHPANQISIPPRRASAPAAPPVSPSESRIVKPRKRASLNHGDGYCFQQHFLSRDTDEVTTTSPQKRKRLG